MGVSHTRMIYLGVEKIWSPTMQFMFERSRALGIRLCALGTDLVSGGISQMQGGVANIPQTYYINILPDYSVDSVAVCVCVCVE